jgi:HlyD family secretion protein
MSVVRVKAEVDEGDVDKIKLDQTAYVKSISRGDEKFQGKVTSIAPTLGSAKIGPRGPLRPTDVEVMEVTIEMTGDAAALKPGMRVDAFFRDN